MVRYLVNYTHVKSNPWRNFEPMHIQNYALQANIYKGFRLRHLLFLIKINF